MTNVYIKAFHRLGYVIAALVIFAALVVSVGHLLTPWMNDHLPDFESWSSELLNVPVKIGHVHISWEIYEPVITFDKVSVLDKETHKPKFAIQKIDVNLNVIRSLAAWKPIMQSIRVEGAHITIRQPTHGAVLIEELKDLIVTDNSTGSLADFNDMMGWVFSQPNLILQNIEMDYHLPRGLKKSITLEQLVLKNTLTQHQLIGEGTLNQPIPTHAKFVLNWTGNIIQLEEASARLYVYLEGISLPQWLSDFSWHQLQIKQGLGSAKIWMTWDKNQFQKIQSQFQFYDLEWLALATHKTQEISRLSGHVGWKRSGEKQIFAGDDILIDLPQHLWPTTHFSVTATQKSDGGYVIENALLSYLDLNDVKKIALSIGLLPEKLQKNLIALDPQGEIRDLHIKSFNYESPDLFNTTLDGEFTNLNFNTWEKFPGVANASGILEWNGTKGNLRLNSQDIAIVYSKLFPHPLKFDQLSGLLHWQKSETGEWTLNAKNLEVSSADLKAHTDMMMSVPPAGSPNINLTIDFSIQRLENLSKYAPARILNPELVVWLNSAFLSGKIESGKIVLQGNLTDYPFEKGKGTFVASGLVKDLDLQYAPGWPSLNHVNGVIIFSRNTMRADINTAQLLDTQLSLLHMEIPYVGEKNPEILQVQGFVNTDFAQALDFIHQSPLNKTLGKDLDGLIITGPMQLKVGMQIPLSHPNNTKIQADLATTDANLKLPIGNLSIEQLNGFMHFTESSIEATNLQARLLNEPISLSLTTENQGTKSAYLKGVLKSKIAISDLASWFNMPLTRYAQGMTNYQAEIHFSSSQNSQPSELILNSNLKGITINLPKPFDKKANEIRNFQWELLLNPKPPLQSKIHYGKNLSAALSFQKNNNELQFLNGEVSLGGGEA